MPPVQPSIALESFLENVKAQLAEITVTKPKNNELTALKELKTNSALNLKKADKGTTTGSHHEWSRKNRRGQSATRQQNSLQTSQSKSKKYAGKD